MHVFKKCFTVALSLVAVASFASSVAMADANAIIKASPSIKKIEATLKARYSDRQTKISKKIENLRLDLVKLDHNKQTMKQAVWQKQHAEKIQTLQTAFHDRATLTQAMMKDQHDALDGLFKKLEQVVKAYAKNHHIDVVLYKNVALTVADDKADITQAVQKRFYAKMA